jgi:hypothetical protein
VVDRGSEGGREWVGRSLTDHVSDAEVLRSTLAIRHWLRSKVRLDSISFCGAIDVLCDAGGSMIFTPDFPSLSHLCSRTVSVRLCLSFPFRRVGLLYSCILYPSCVLYQICAGSDGASLLCPLEPSRRPHPCRLPSPVHYSRGCAAAFRPRGLRTILLLWRVRERGRGRGRGSGVRTCPYGRLTKEASGECPDCYTRLEV